VDLFYEHIKEISIITMLVILAGLTTTGYLIGNDSLATWAQTSFGGYFGYYIGGRSGKDNSNTDHAGSPGNNDNTTENNKDNR
jgi:hypothetical protein